MVHSVFCIIQVGKIHRSASLNYSFCVFVVFRPVKNTHPC
jgi:hypothetical protein